MLLGPERQGFIVGAEGFKSCNGKDISISSRVIPLSNLAPAALQELPSGGRDEP